MIKRAYVVIFILLVGVCLNCDFAVAADLVLRDAPCRLVDTRNIGGTGLGPKVSSLTIETWGEPGTLQGGQSGCGVKYGTSGVLVSLTVFQPTSAGYARLWKFGATEPLSTSISYAEGQTDESTGLPVSTGFMNGKISLHAPFGQAHFIVDLLGSLDGGGGGSEGFPAPRHLRVLSFINAPISGSQPGNRHVVFNPTAVPFIGHDNEYATWKGIPGCSASTESCWDFEEPSDGDFAYEASQQRYWRFRALGVFQWDIVGP